MVQITSQERIQEEVVDDPIPQIVKDTVVEQNVAVPVIQFQKGVAEQILDSTVPTQKEELLDVAS